MSNAQAELDENRSSRILNKCPSCGSSRVKNIGAVAQTNVFAGQELDYLISPSSLFFCISCDLSFKFPQLEKEVLDDLYEQGATTNWQYSPSERNDWQLARKWIAAVPENSSILDVGCFDGQFLSSLASGWQRFGIEVHKDAANRAEVRGIQIISRDFGRIEAIDQQVDVVIATDVIEHMPDPLLFLRKITGITRRNGLIIISTGNTKSRSWRFMGSRYWYCTLAEHLSFICPAWVEKAAPQLGLRLERVELFSHADSSWRGIVADALRNTTCRLLPSLFRALRRSGFGGMDCGRFPELAGHPPTWLSAKDHMIVQLRKL